MEDVRVSVSKELHEHYQLILQRRNALLDPDSYAEEKDVTAAMNAATSVIRDLARIQQDLYNSEVFAYLQAEVVNALGECDPELQERVITAFEAKLEALRNK